MSLHYIVPEKREWQYSRTNFDRLLFMWIILMLQVTETRNSAIADTPRDTFVQIQWHVADLLNTMLYLVVLR